MSTKRIKSHAGRFDSWLISLGALCPIINKIRNCNCKVAPRPSRTPVDVKLNPTVPPDDLSLGRSLLWGLKLKLAVRNILSKNPNYFIL